MHDNNSKVYAYARVSSVGQNESRQLTAIKEYVQRNNIALDERDIIVDKASGKDFERPGYQALLRFLRSGDILIIKELDRFSRSYEGMKAEWQRLTQMHINIVIIDTPLLSTLEKSDLEKTLTANIVFEILAYASAKERNVIKQRISEGIQSARQKGMKFGRPKTKVPDNFYGVKEKWLAGEISAKQAMITLGLKRTTFYKLVK